MKVSRSLFCLVALGTLALSAGCGAHDSDEKYYLVSANIEVPYWQQAGAGFSKAAAKLKVKAEFVGPRTYDPQAQLQEFERVAKLKPSGILVSPADPDLMKPAIDNAIAAGIPVITMDSDSPESKRLVFIGTNNYQAGLMGGKLAVKQLQGQGNVVVFTMPGQNNLRERLRGYQDAFAGQRIKIDEVVDIQGDPRIAFDRTVEILNKKGKDVAGFICLEALAGKEVATVLSNEHAAGKVVIAMDADEDTMDWIKRGLINATIAQKPFTMSYFGLMMLDELHHQHMDPQDASKSPGPFSTLPAFVDTGTALVDKNNLQEFVQARQAATPRKSP